MDYRFSDEEESFRAEVREFLRSELPEDWDFDPFELTEDKWDFARDFTKKLAGKGWVAPAWPQEYGGQGMPYMKQVVLSEEIAYHRAPHTRPPGVSVRPLVNMADEHVFNEIIFDNVRVPVKYLVGEENRGWYIGMTTLDFERSNISTAAQYRRTFEQLVEYAKEQGARSKEPGN